MEKIHILQNLKSDEHQDAMFYSGVVAVTPNKVNGKYVCLMTRDAEIVYNDNKYIGQEIANLGAMYVICDVDIEDEVDVHVDGFFYIAEFNPTTLEIQDIEDVDDDYIFDNYDEAIEVFEDYV
jgi:hypothetical protein